ncbi:hypothetical protein HY415_02725 [Candidatus Kaiserbacteria bacterium]|nr:hypothetical protein [Candidatus Kaiserbacteria bacterium]
MTIAIATASIIAIAGLIWLANRILPFAICPVCAGVFLTWVGLVGAHFVGYQIDLIVPALLMGGSVVGIAYQLEKKFGVRTLWKVFFIPVGFIAAYAILKEWWAAFLLAVAFLAAISARLLPAKDSTADSRKEATADIKKKMENCC